MPRFACTSSFAHSGISVALRHQHVLCFMTEHTEPFELSLRLWKHKSPSEMSLFQTRFSRVLHCFIWFRVIHWNHKTVIVEVPLVTKYRNKYKVCFHWIATKTNSLLFYSSLLIIIIWSTFQLWHYKWRDIHIVYNWLAASVSLQNMTHSACDTDLLRTEIHESVTGCCLSVFGGSGCSSGSSLSLIAIYWSKWRVIVRS